MRQRTGAGGVARVNGATQGGGSFLRRSLPRAQLRAVPEVRHALRALLHDWGTDDLRDSTELLTCELVTNALLHAEGDAQLTAALVPHGLRVEVRDASPRGPRPPGSTGPQAEPLVPDADTGTSGRGLLLVRALADSWGVRAHEDGKSVWFELDG